MASPSPRLGYALVAAGSGLFVVNAGISRVVLRAGIDTAQLTSLRVTGAAIGLGLLAGGLRPEVLRPPRGRSLLLVVALGLTGVALLQWAYFVAIDRLTVGTALLIQYTAPILVALWARFVQREEVRGRLWFALGLSMVGLAMTAQVWQGMVLDPIGVAAGFGAAAAFSAYFLLGEHGVNRQDPLAVILWSFAIAAVALNLFSPVTGLSGSSARSSVNLLGALDGWSAPLWALLGWVVIPGTLVPFALELHALQHLKATTVTTVAMLEPVGAMALGWMWFGESLTPVQSIGGLLVVTAILLAASARRRRPALDPVPAVI